MTHHVHHPVTKQRKEKTKSPNRCDDEFEEQVLLCVCVCFLKDNVFNESVIELVSL